MTTITPALGHGPWTQQGVGTTPGYDAIDARRFWSAGLQEGVLPTGSYEVTQRAASANMSVDIAATTGDGALVKGDAVTAQGLYYVAPHTAVINEAISTAHATLPRVDRIVCELKDNQHDASGSNLAQTRVVAGTATAGATLDNLTGAAAVPSSALLLADVLVGAAATTVTNAVIRDRRPWARGAYVRMVRTAGDLTTASGTLVAIDSTNLSARIECSGVPLRISLHGLATHSLSNAQAIFGILFDGAGIDSTNLALHKVQVATATADYPLAFSYVTVPAAGSHTIAAGWAAAATATVRATTLTPLVFTIEEIVRQNTKNNPTTTG